MTTSIHRPKWQLKTDPACQFKWTWSTLFLNFGTTSSCHRCKHWEVTVENFMDFHNLPGKVSDREKMLQGQWPGNGCEYCKVVEEAGGVSERIGYINDLEMVPPENEINPEETHVTPRLLEVYFSNLCNMSCTYCSAKFSSVIQHENEKFGEFTKNGLEIYEWPDNPEYEKMRDMFWDWMDLHGQELYTLHVLGGEPLFQPEFEMFLDWFDKNPCPNLEWVIFSNLKHNTIRLVSQVERIQKLIDDGKLKAFQVNVSIDNYGKEAEYARHGIIWEQFVDNFTFLASQKWIGMQVQSTICPITVQSMWQLYDFILSFNDSRINLSWNTIQDPKWFNPSRFGTYCLDGIDKLIARLKQSPFPQHHNIPYLEGIRNQISKATCDPYEMIRFKTHLDELDVRRNLDWKSIYPDLAEHIEKNISTDDVLFQELKILGMPTGDQEVKNAKNSS